MSNTNSTAANGITTTIMTADTADMVIREKRYAYKGAASVSMELSYAGAGMAINYAANDGIGWCRAPRRVYRTEKSARANADRRWDRLIALLG